MNVLILGANGFIGRHLARRLAADPAVELTLFSRSFAPEFLAELPARVKTITGNFANPLSLSPALRNQTVVYHLISESVASSSWDTPLAEIDANLRPTVRLLQLCVDSGVRKVVFASSGGTVYGAREERCAESDPLRPFAPYGIVKVAIENYLEYFRVRSGLQYGVYRISNPYGPGLDKPGFGVINTWLRAALRGRQITVYGDGSASKDYLYIDDLIHFLLHALRHPAQSATFNVASGEISSLNDILAALSTHFPNQLKVDYKPGSPGDNRIVRIENSRLLTEYPGYPFITLEDGIKRTLAHLQKQL